MIERISGLDDGVIGMRAIGQLTVKDFANVVEPELERFDDAKDGLRLVLHLGTEFTGFGEGAWGELTREIRHVRFHKGAVVTDDHHVRRRLNVLKWALRGDVRIFRNREYDDALAWVAS